MCVLIWLARLTQVLPFRHGRCLLVAFAADKPQGAIVPVRTFLVGDEFASRRGMVDDGKHGAKNLGAVCRVMGTAVYTK